MIQPIPSQQKLAPQVSTPPRFSTSVKTADGSTLAVADPRATRALISLMDMNAVLGGAASHYGGPAALAELMSALHGFVFRESEKKKKSWFELFHLVNDAGHCENGLYALKANYGMAGLTLASLKKFRSIESPLTGHGEVHCFPEGVYLSNGPLGSAFPQTQGLALGDALAGRWDRTTVCVVSDGASMEGEAKESFAAIPGLARQGKMAPYVMIISDNNTKLSGRIDHESFSMQPSFESLKVLGWNVLVLEQGNDLQKCFDVMEKAFALAKENPKVPVCIHAKTVKGIGTKKTAESSSGGHGFPLKSPTELQTFLSEIYNQEKFPEEFNLWIQELMELENEKKKSEKKDPNEKIQKGVAAALSRAFKNGYPVISVTSDLPGSTGVAEFRKEFPQASLDVGVAESNMVSTAAGLSKLGYIPVVDTFAQFGVTKGSLPLTMASLSEAPMICIFSHTGFQDAADGASHQALSYFAMTSSIPHVDVYMLTCSEEAEALVEQAVLALAREKREGHGGRTRIFFLGRENFPKNYKAQAQYDLNKAQVVSDTTEVSSTQRLVLAGFGSMMPEVVKAQEILKSKGVGVVLINPGLANRVDFNCFREALNKCKGKLLTVEDHQVTGGAGAYLVHQLSIQGLLTRANTLGVQHEFGQSAYNAIDLYRKHGLDSESIVRRALELMG